MPSTDIQRCGSIFLIFLRLGLTSFGGPVAHLAFFRDEFVTRRAWLSERGYADLVALCQFLPGPASSQVGMALGLSRGGYRGALAAWAGFTLPSALLLTLLALGMGLDGMAFPEGALRGLKIVAVAVVAQAVYAMARQHCSGLLRALLMALGCAAALWLPYAWAQLAIIVGAGLLGLLLFKPAAALQADSLAIPIGARAGVLWATLFLLLLAGLPLLATLSASPGLALLDTFYRVGALVFGGGHVVLPLLQNEVVTAGWVDADRFVAGYGAAQAVPGPLFTFAAFLGASMQGAVSGWSGALLCLFAIFMPSFLLLAGVLPFWGRLRANRRTQAALIGVNAAVVGLLLAALYRPVWTSAIAGLEDFALAALALVALAWCKRPPWQVVMAGALIGWLLP